MKRCEHPIVWSPYASGGKPRCFICTPPEKGQAKRIGILVDGQVMTAGDIRRLIADTNKRAIVMELLSEAADLIDDPQVKANLHDFAPAPEYRVRRLVGEEYDRPASEPPSPDLVMSQDSPFWVDRGVEADAIAEYNEAVKPEPKPGSSPTKGGGEIPEGSRRIRRSKR